MDTFTGEHPVVWFAIKIAIWIVGAFFAWGISEMWWGPHYQVWKARKEGEADLAQAHGEQAIQIAKAQNRLAAAEANKKAAIVEAEAVQEQIKIIGENVKNHPLYLTWQWIEMMRDRKGATIYVPTEANLPILEARSIGAPDKK